MHGFDVVESMRWYCEGEIERLRCERYDKIVCSNRWPNVTIMCREVKIPSSSVMVNKVLREMMGVQQLRVPMTTKTRSSSRFRTLSLVTTA